MHDTFPQTCACASNRVSSINAHVNMETIDKECCVRGYHIYKNIWDVSLIITIGGELASQREPSNGVDQWQQNLNFRHLSLLTNCTKFYPCRKIPAKQYMYIYMYMCVIMRDIHVHVCDNERYIIM